MKRLLVLSVVLTINQAVLPDIFKNALFNTDELTGKNIIKNTAPINIPVSQNSKRFNQYSQLVSHNSTSLLPDRVGGLIPNPTGDQNNNVQIQLNQKIRAFKIPIHLKGDDALWISHTMAKAEFYNWLDKNIKV